MSIEQETTNKNEAYGSRPLPPSPSKRPMAHQRSTFSLKKGRSYEEEIPKKISNQQEIEEEKLVQATSKSKRKSPESALTPSKSPSKLALPGRNKRRNSKNAIDPTETIEMASSSHSDTSNSINNNINGLFQSSFSKDAEEIKDHLKTEKDKNKRRNRKKYSDTNGTESTPSILGMSSTPLSNPKIGSGSGSKNESPSLLNTQRKDAPEGDNLHEARHRMHKLLDEAFALITPRSSFNENDRQHAQVKDTEKERDIDTLVASRPDDPSGDPGYINPAYASSYSEYLQIWSPYRAADQVALISMPNIAAPVVTKQGGSKMKQNKRPVSNLTFIKTKSSTVLDNTSKYTNDPGKPIRLRIKSERGSSERPIQMTNNYVGERQFSVSSLREDARLPQSSTSLSKTIKTSSAKRAESDKTETTIEMRKHRRPDRNLGDKDVVDILNDIKPEEKTDTLLKSLRDELAACKMESEGDINSKPIRRKGRKPTKPMTNIV
ncbi:uncharacterized protein LOC127841416 [Dreissena polymorpha]|nr:uncharacterized protein LOC127841416 [Dreissena polymorpha]